MFLTMMVESTACTMRTVAYNSFFIRPPVCSVGEGVFIPETSPLRREMLSLRTTLTISLDNIYVFARLLIR